MTHSSQQWCCLTQPFNTSAPHITAMNEGGVKGFGLYTGGNTNSDGSRRRRTWRKRLVKNRFVCLTIMDHPKLLLGTVTLLGLSTLTRAGKKRRGPRSELFEPFGAIFVHTWDRSTAWHSSIWIINRAIISGLYSENVSLISATGIIPVLLATWVYSLKDGSANNVSFTFFKMLFLMANGDLSNWF